MILVLLLLVAPPLLLFNRGNSNEIRILLTPEEFVSKPSSNLQIVKSESEAIFGDIWTTTKLSSLFQILSIS
jgi:hypothetical protein